MSLVKEGDEEAFIEIIRRYEKRLINFFYHLGWDYYMSEDLTQEVFLKVYRYRKSYAQTAAFKTFIYTIAKNLWIDHLRRAKHDPDRISLDTPVGSGLDRGLLRDVIQDEQAREPSSRTEQAEIADAIMKSVDTLDEQDQLIFMMIAKEKLKYKEVAEILDIPEGTVKSKLYYIYRKLRNRLKDYDPDEM